MVRWRDDGDARLGAHDRNVFQPVMAQTIVPIFHAAADAHDAHGPLMLNRPVADEFVGSQHRKGNNRIHEWDEAGFRQSRGQADHVLFGHAHVDELFRVCVRKWFQGHVAQVAGKEQNPRVARRQFGQGLGEGGSHGFDSISARASRYSASDMGQ